MTSYCLIEISNLGWAVIREIFEETRIKEYKLHFKGLITWSVDGNQYGGMFLYIAELDDQFVYDY